MVVNKRITGINTFCNVQRWAENDDPLLKCGQNGSSSTRKSGSNYECSNV